MFFVTKQNIWNLISNCAKRQNNIFPAFIGVDGALNFRKYAAVRSIGHYEINVKKKKKKNNRRPTNETAEKVSKRNSTAYTCFLLFIHHIFFAYVVSESYKTIQFDSSKRDRLSPKKFYTYIWYKSNAALVWKRIKISRNVNVPLLALNIQKKISQWVYY